MESSPLASACVAIARSSAGKLHLVLYLIMIGAGRPLFPERWHTPDFTLASSHFTPHRGVIQTYRPTGRAIFGSAA